MPSPVPPAGRRDADRSFADREHEELAIGLDRLHDLTEHLSSLPVDQRAASVHAALAWIDTTLEPHMSWEETWLFPRIEDRAAGPGATRLARLDHRRILAHAERLDARCANAESYPADVTGALAQELGALEALIQANLEREDRGLLPLLPHRAVPARR